MQMNRLDKTEQVLCCVIGHDTLWGSGCMSGGQFLDLIPDREVLCVCLGITATIYCTQDTLRTHGSTVGILWQMIIQVYISESFVVSDFM